ncbi:hypothetical protein N431DRAFT_424773 [Stipitochalara longipes BDJ]|nr:hypothetical protein N431DRAFT_424773 [Stipitochalara longipes BDJ]
MVDPGENEAFRRDLSNLTSTVEKTVPMLNGLPCCDPELRSLMLRTHEGQISAQGLRDALHLFAPGFEQAYFQTSLVSKEMIIIRVVDDNGTEAIRLVDFLRIILYQSPKYLREVELAIKKVIRKEHLFQLDRNNEEEETYCSLYEAEKLLHHLHREGHTRLLDLTPPKHTEACWYNTQHTVHVPISHHEPTGMVNLTQILNLFESDVVQEVLRRLDTSNFREIRGSQQWDGHYVRRSALGEIFSRLSLPMKHYSWDDNKQSHPIDQFFGEEGTVSIATDEMINLILFDRQDEKIIWGSRTLTTQDAIKLSEDHGLPVARDTLVRVTSESSSASSIFYSDDDIMKLFDHSDESDYPTEATSHNSFQSQDTVCFIPKKKKRRGNPDIPILPAQRKVSAKEEITPVQKVEEWVAAGPDIRPTRFTSSKKGEGSRRR